MPEGSYGKKDGLKNLDRVRIERPEYEKSKSAADSIKSQVPNKTEKIGGEMPPLAPNIVNRNNHRPAVAPAPGGTSDSGSGSASSMQAPLPVPVPAPTPTSKSRIARPSYESVEKAGAAPNKIPVANPSPDPSQKSSVDAREANSAGLNLIEQVPKFARENAPASEKPGNGDIAGATSPSAAGGTTIEQYPMVGRLENLTFGKASPDRDVAARLGSLESSIFARTYDDDSLFDRTERLKRTLLGEDGGNSMISDDLDGYDPYAVTSMAAPLTGSQGVESDFVYLDELAKNPENFSEQPGNVVQAYALELINFERRKRSLKPLEPDKLLQDMADQQMTEMLELRQLSHSDQYGQNPDRRYTLMGGVDAVAEGLVATSTADLNSSKLTKAAVCVLLKKMLLRQDDREALLSAEATHLATAFGTAKNGTKIFGCTEVLTRRAKIDALKTTLELGDKVTVKGEIFKPYGFDKITIAWEEALDSPVEEEPSSDEALPYFPPLDYVAYDTRAERDHSKAITALKALGVMAAIAGGMFVPPVALAAPLIVMAGPGGSEMRPQSDIPVKGGVKLNGSHFKVQVPLDNEDQEGLYYITVWATLGEGSRPVAVSRRAIMVKKDRDKGDDETNKNKEPSQVKSDPKQYTNGNDAETGQDSSDNDDSDDDHKEDDTGI